MRLLTSCSSSQCTEDMDDFAKALESVFSGKATILNRMRLACSFYDRELRKIGEEGDGKTSLLFFGCKY